MLRQTPRLKAKPAAAAATAQVDIPRADSHSPADSPAASSDSRVIEVRRLRGRLRDWIRGR